MPKSSLPILIPVKGLDISKPGELIDSRGTPACRNIEISRSVFSKRIGGSALGATLAERVMGYGQLQLGSTIHVVRAGLADFQSLAQSTSTWTTRASAPLTAAVTDRYSFCYPLLSGANILVYTNGKDAIRKWTGTGNDAALGGSPPIAKYVVTYGNYLVLLNIATFPSRVQWADTGAPETWGSGNAGSVDLVSDPEPINGGGIFGDYLTVHKDNSIYVGYLVSTSDVFRFDRKNTGVGAVSHDTIRTLPTGYQIFLGRDGLHLFNGQTAPVLESPAMDELREEINPDHLYKSWGVVMQDLEEYWLGVATGSQTETETIYKYNYRTGQVYKDYRANATTCFPYTQSTSVTWASVVGTWASQTGSWDSKNFKSPTPIALFGDTSGNSVRRASVYNDNLSAISAFWESKDYSAMDLGNDQMDTFVRWTGMQLWAKGDTLTLEYSTDAGENWTTIETLTLSSGYPSDSSPIISYFDVISTQIRFRLSNSVINESFTVKKFMIDALMREAMV